MTATWIVEVVVSVVLFALLIGVAFSDISRNRIRNWMTLSALALGVFLNVVLGGVYSGSLQESPSLFFSLSGILIGGGMLIPFYLSGGIGAGDVKLMAAIGSLKGWFFAMTSLLYGSLFGCLIALLMLAWHRQFFAGLRSSFKVLLLPSASRIREAAASETKDIKVPYGFAIAAGAITAWFLG